MSSQGLPLTKLDAILSEIDISSDKYQEAESRYKKLGEWLDREDSSIKEFRPKIYPQGSFRMGTAIKPITSEEGFDVDLVCELELTRTQITQADLKSLVGAELEAYREQNGFKKPLDDGRRCWTIEYSDGSQFHMDILPAISDAEYFRSVLIEAGYKDFAKSNYNETAISITDNTLPEYNSRTEKWQQSNPIGYSDWFFEQTEKRKQLKKQASLESITASLEDIPNYQKNTPLQKAIKLLKRHRDSKFKDQPDNKPISVIISTLTATLYQGESNATDIIFKFATEAETLIEEKNNEHFITNPVNPLENFADKWKEKPERRTAFFDWIKLLKQDLVDASTTTTLSRNGKRVSIQAAFSVDPKQPSASGFFPTKFEPPLPISQINPPHRLKPIYPEDLDPNASVTIKCIENSKSLNKKEIQNFDEVSKFVSITFEACLNAAWTPDEIKWQVVNTGQDAKDNSCLRGGYYSSDFESGNRYRRKERTEYSGTHCVECFFHKNGKIKARTGDFLIKIK